MANCGDGWSIECEHGRRYFNTDGLPYFEVAASMRHSDTTNHNVANGTAKDRSNLLVDLIQIRCGCNDKKATVTLDGEGAYFNSINRMHHVIAWYEKDNIVHTEDVNNTYSFIKCVRDAFEYIALAEKKKHVHMLKVDGDKLPIHVFPGEVFELDVDLPGLYSQKVSRGINAKKDPALLGRPDANELPDKKKPGINTRSSETQNAKNRKKRLKRNMQREEMAKIMAAGFWTATEKERKVLGFEYSRTNRYDPFKLKQKGDQREEERQNKNVSGVEKGFDKTIHGLLSLPVVLKRNDQAIRLSEVESLLALIAISRRILRLIHSIQDRVPRVGAYWEFKLDLLKVQMKLLWGFAELENHEVTPFRALGAEVDLVDADFELGFGLKKGSLVAAVFFRFEGKVSVKAAWLEPCLPDMEEPTLPGVEVILTPGIGAKISAGDLLTAQAIGQCDFVIDMKFNPDYEGEKDEDLLGASINFKNMRFGVVIKAFDVGLVDFQQINTQEWVAYEGGLLKQENEDDAPEGTPETFRQQLCIEGQAIRNGKKWDEGKYGFIVAQNEHVSDWYLATSELVPINTLVDDIIAAIRTAIGPSHYEKYFDFAPKTAEQLMQDVASRIIRSPDFINPRGSTWVSHEAAISHTNFLRLLRNEIKVIAENYIDPTKYLRGQMT